MSLFFKVKTW